MKTMVMKFGGAAFQDIAGFSRASSLILYQLKKNMRVVVVVSAMGITTDELIDLAYQVSKSPSSREMDMLISAGERISMSLLAMSLENIGVSAISLTGSQSGILTTDQHSNARIKSINPVRILQSFQSKKVVIIAGFQGVSEKGKEITTLGRGGSDTTAVAVGVALKACRVEFYKDVVGLYNADPKKTPSAQLYDQISFEKALKLSDHVIHPRSINLALKNGLPLRVLTYDSLLHETFAGTVIGEKAMEECAPIYEV